MSAAAERIEDEGIPPKEDHFVVLDGVTWEDFERLLAIRGDRAGPRMTYIEGVLEIMRPSRSHESIKSVIGRLVETFCLERGIEFSTYGSWTVKDEASKRGVEPDECYVFGERPDAERPDLAIEVVWTRGGLDKLDAYRMLGVREVWYWRRRRLSAHELRGEAYHPIDASRVLQGIDLDELARFIDAPTTSAAIRGYRDALRG